MLLVSIITEQDDPVKLKALIQDSLFDIEHTVIYDSAAVNSVNPLSFYEHLTSVSLRLQQLLLFETPQPFDIINVPVLVVLDHAVNFKKLIQQRVDTDIIFFDNLHHSLPTTMIYGSVLSIVKTLASAYKIEHLFDNDQGNIEKSPFSGPFHNVFQLIWYAQKIGLKVYEAK
jgi:hypothetical protein